MGTLDYRHVCGKGSTGCTGSKWNLTCECGDDGKYVVAPDGKSCIPSKFESSHQLWSVKYSICIEYLQIPPRELKIKFCNL